MMQELIDEALKDAGLDISPKQVEQLACQHGAFYSIWRQQCKDGLKPSDEERRRPFGAWTEAADKLAELANRRIAAGYAVQAFKDWQGSLV